MIITIILGTLLVLSIGWVIFEKIKYGFTSYSEVVAFISGFLFFTGVLVPICCVKIKETIEYPKMQYERQVILKEYDECTPYNQIIVHEKVKEFNEKIIKENTLLNNKWISIYGMKKVASIDYIELFEFVNLNKK